MIFLNTSLVWKSISRSKPSSLKYLSTLNVKDGPYNFVDGEKSHPIDSIGFTNALNPATSVVLARVALSGASEVDKAVKSSKEAYNSWSLVLFFYNFYMLYLLTILKSFQVLKEENLFLVWGRRYLKISKP